jgi:hypothetical protein
MVDRLARPNQNRRIEPPDSRDSIALLVVFDQAPAPAVRWRRPRGARRNFDRVAGFRRTAGEGASWRRIQYSPKAIAPPTSSRNRSGDANRFLKGRKGIMSVTYAKSRFVTSRVP